MPWQTMLWLLPVIMLVSAYVFLHYLRMACQYGILGMWIPSHRRRQQTAPILARCEKQHKWVLEGDPRGIYGMNPYQSLEDQVLEWQAFSRQRRL